MMKPAMGAVMIAALSMVSGCDSAHESQSRTDNDTAQPREAQIVTINYWTRSWWGDPTQFQGDESRVPAAQWRRRQIDEFERQHPHVRVNLQVDPGGRGDKIRVAFAGGVPPDVFHGGPDTEFIAWASLGLLEPVDDYLTEYDMQDIYPGALQTTVYEGKHYAWPLYNHALGVVINRDLFRERGLADRIPGPDTAWTLEEFEDLARQLTFDRDDDGRADVYGVGLHMLDANHVFLTTYLVNHGARVFDERGRFVLDSDAGVAGLTFLRRLIDQRIATPGAAGYQADDVRQLFVDGRAAMYLTSAGTLTWADDQVRQGVIQPRDWALVPVPSVEGVTATTYLTVGAVFVSRQEDPVKRDACMALARFLTGAQVNRHFWRMASPRRSSEPPGESYMAAMMKQVEGATNFMLPPRRMPDRFNLNEEMVRLYQDTLSLRPRYSPDEGLSRLAERINQAMDRQEALR